MTDWVNKSEVRLWLSTTLCWDPTDPFCENDVGREHPYVWLIKGLSAASSKNPFQLAKAIEWLYWKNTGIAQWTLKEEGLMSDWNHKPERQHKQCLCSGSSPMISLHSWPFCTCFMYLSVSPCMWAGHCCPRWLYGHVPYNAHQQPQSYS